jgi:hypothetical protein
MMHQTEARFHPGERDGKGTGEATAMVPIQWVVCRIQWGAGRVE